MEHLRNDPLARGCVAGMAEVCPVGHTLWALSTVGANNSERPSLGDLMRKGLKINTLGMVPSTGIQVLGNSLFHQLLYGSASPTHFESAVTATLAGAVSSLVLSPIEFVMTREQLHPKGSKWAFGEHAKRYGLRSFAWGLPLAAFRDGLFTLCWKALYPLVKEKTDSRALGVFSVGTFAGFVTQPAHTVKAVQQGSDKPKAAYLVAKEMIAPGGIKALWKGYLPRQARVYWALFAISEVDSLLKPTNSGKT